MVRILDRGEPVEQAVCELLTMPDGRTGALHAGLVFPVVDESIDIAGTNAVPAACRPLADTATPSRPRLELVEGETEAVLLVDGSVVERDELAATLRAHGLAVIAVGARLVERPGDPGWFVRFRRPEDDGRDLAARVDAALAAAPVRPAPPAAQLEARAAELRRLRAERDAADAAAARERDALLARIAELESALAAAAPPAPAATPVGPAAPRPRGESRLQDEITRMLRVFAPSVELVQDSLPTIVTELYDREPLYAALRELETGGRGMPLGWKRLADGGGWWERHLATGRDHSGRLYARHDPARSRWSVLVSSKARQKSDIAWLRRQPAV